MDTGFSGRYDDHGVVEVLDAVQGLFTARVAADAELFELAGHFTDLNSGDSLKIQGKPLPGRERAVRLGGEGTPKVAEFACLAFGVRMQMGSYSARFYLADVLDTRHRLPETWARVQAREARVPWVRLVASRTRHLSMEAAARVDAAMVDYVDGSLPWGRFETRLAGTIVEADPEAAAAREAAKAAEQFAKRTRSSEDGTAGFYVRSTIGVIARIDASVAFVAEALRVLGDAESLDARRVKAMVVLSNPTQAVELLAAFAAHRAHSVDEEPQDQPQDEPQVDDDEDEAGEPAPSKVLDRVDAFARRVAFTPTHLPAWLAARSGEDSADGRKPEFAFDWSRLLPPVTLHLHGSVETFRHGGPSDRGGVVRWEGEGPITQQFVHDHLRPLHRFVIQPVIDLAHQAPVDAYEVPDRHRTAVRLRTPADCSPFSANLRPTDIDHTKAYEPAPSGAGEKAFASRLANYGPLGRFNHRLKTFGNWTVRQPFSGIYLWRDPHGQVFLVDHTGTRQVTQRGSPAGAARRFDPEIEFAPVLHPVELDTG